MTNLVVEGEFLEGMTWDVAARPVNEDGVVIVLSAVTDLRVYMYDLDSAAPGTNVYGVTSDVKSDGMLGALTTGSGWTADDTGYTLRYSLDPAQYTPQGGHRYRAELKITSGGKTYWVVAIGHCVSVIST